MPRLLRLLSAILIALCSLAFVPQASAQLDEEVQAYLEQWRSTADRAEDVIEAQRASSNAFESLREQLSEYRETFNNTRTQSTDRIKTLENQLEVLGPRPEDGSEEPQDIARLRQGLEDQLNELRVPQIIAEQAYARADGLIREIDRIIRERQADKLLSRGPSPLNPQYWPEAWRTMEQVTLALVAEISSNMGKSTVREQIQDRAPVLIFLVVLGTILLARGKHWSEWLGELLRKWGGRGHGVWEFVISLFRILLPWLGVLALVVAIILTEIPGIHGTLLLEQVPAWAATLLYFNWIGRQAFAMRSDEELEAIPTARIWEIRLVVDMLAMMLVLFSLVKLIEQVENLSDPTRAVLAFPIILASGLLLLRLNAIRSFAREERATVDDGEDGPSRAGFTAFVEIVRRILFIMGVVSPILAAAGYTYAAEAIVLPAIKTLSLFATMFILQRFFTTLYGWISGKGEAASESLFSVVIGFVLAVVSLPILALYWGARTTDLTELWARVVGGFEIGGVTISLSSFLAFAVVFVIGYSLTRLMQSGLKTSLLPKTKIDPGGQNAIVSGTGYIGIFLAAIVAITIAGFDLSSLAIVAGALSVGIGFGLQTIVSNFVSGIILLIERPISKGDWIDVNGLMGYVRDISVRSTRIETFDRTDVIVPNSDLISGTVTNYTRGNTVGRVIVPVGVAYGTDTRKVEKILREIGEAHPMVLLNPPPSVVFQGFGADSLDFEIRAILRDVNWVLSVKSDMNYEIARRFAEEGIDIPFAQRDIWLRNPEALTKQPDGVSREASDETTSGSGRPVDMTASDLDNDPDSDY
ncbi:DUF3772 domain-containing protein [Lutimaribacter marinistellae]|uniref:DUF3772 domain-containing protein n=1 Tax=Lutimaribacter marinistellae TaxID=1820329 RepID=A0ABV7TK35_9RHOB